MKNMLILYHYYYPDDVVSAVQFTGLAEGLAERGLVEPIYLEGSTHTNLASRHEASTQWEVEVWPSNRSCFGTHTFSTKVEIVKGVKVRRVWHQAHY